MYLCIPIMEDKKYIVDLKGLKTDKLDMEYQLEDAYFKAFDNNDVKGGNVRVRVSVNKISTDSFVFRFEFEGHVKVICDLCLDDMSQSVKGEEELKVVFGSDYEDKGDNLIVIPEDKGVIDLSTFMYEFIILAVPIKHVHTEGKCNDEMIKKLNEYMVTSCDDENDQQNDATDPKLDNN